MYTLSENFPEKDVCVQNGKGLIHIKELTDKAGSIMMNRQSCISEDRTRIIWGMDPRS